jgi:hypothetical protein
MRTSALIARISAQCPLFACVDHALSPAKELTYPAAMVVPSELAAAPDGLFGIVHDQDIVQKFSVFVLIGRREDTSIWSGVDDLDDLTAQLRAALLGWEVDNDHAPMNLAGGKLDRYITGIVCWREDYSVETSLRV